MTLQSVHSNTALAGSHPMDRTKAAISGTGRGRGREHDRGRLEFRLIFAAAFLFFLVTSAFERAIPSRWASHKLETGPRKSVIEQAKESAGIAAGYAFMG